MFLSADKPLNELPAVSLNHISPPPHHHHLLTSFVPPSSHCLLSALSISLCDSLYLKCCHSHKVLFLHYNNSFLELLNIYMNPINVRVDCSVQVSGWWGLDCWLVFRASRCIRLQKLFIVKLSAKCNRGSFVNLYVSNLSVKAYLRQKSHFYDLPYFVFWVKLIFNGSSMGTFTIASKSLCLKQ